MNVQELFRRLSFGELTNLSMSVEGTGTIAEESRGKIISYANEGLLRLHSRFLLREQYIELELDAAIFNYHLKADYAQTNPTPPADVTLYIKDSVAAPFTGDVIRVLKVVDDEGCEIPLNNAELDDSVFTPQPDILQVKEPVTDAVIGLIYQARHPLLQYSDLSQVIDLPAVLEGALQSFVAHKVFSHMNGAENGAKAAEHFAMYEMIVNEVLTTDAVNSSSYTSNIKFHRRGFV